MKAMDAWVVRRKTLRMPLNCTTSWRRMEKMVGILNPLAKRRDEMQHCFWCVVGDCLFTSYWSWTRDDFMCDPDNPEKRVLILICSEAGGTNSMHTSS